MSNARTTGTNGSSSAEVGANQVRQRSMAYPRYSLRHTEEFARAVFQAGPRRCDPDVVARKVGYSNEKNGSFKSLQATAKYFGLVSVEGGCISVTDEWIEVFNSEDAETAKRTRRKAMREPTLYRMLLDEYADRMLPPREKLARDLFLKEKYGIVKEAAERAAEVFIESASYADMVDERNFLRVDSPAEEMNPPAKSDAAFANDFMSDLFGSVGSQAAKQQQRSAEEMMPQAAQAVVQSNPQQQVIRGGDGDYQTVVIPAELERHEVQLRNGKKAYLFIPVPLPAKERQRLQQYIGLILDEDDVEPQGPSARQQMIEWEEAS